MNYLFLHTAQGLGGAEKRFFHLLQYFEDYPPESDRISVIIGRTFLNSIGEKLNSVGSNFKVYKYGFVWSKKTKLTRYLDYISLILVLIRLLSIRFDAVHYFLRSGVIFRKFIRAKKHGISSFTSPKDLLHEEISDPAYAKLMQLGYKVDCLDENIYKAIMTLYPHNRANIFLSPCSFLSHRLQPKENVKKHSIAFVGRLESFKGIELLMTALPEIIAKTNYHIYILGNGSLKNKLQDLRIEISASDRITLDFIPNPMTLLQTTEIFLSLQRDENYPSQSLLEALFCKNAIIATNVGLTPKIVKNEFGFLIDDSKDIVNALIYLEHNPSKASEMGKSAFDFLMSNHNVEIFCKYFKSIYETKE